MIASHFHQPSSMSVCVVEGMHDDDDDIGDRS